MDNIDLCSYVKKKLFSLIVPNTDILQLHLCKGKDPKAALKVDCQQSHCKDKHQASGKSTLYNEPDIDSPTRHELELDLVKKDT